MAIAWLCGERPGKSEFADYADYGRQAANTVLPLKLESVTWLTDRDGLEHYRPEAVTCTTRAGAQVSALCYNLPNAPAPDEANEEYAGHLRAVLTKLGFPAEYIVRVH